MKGFCNYYNTIVKNYTSKGIEPLERTRISEIIKLYMINYYESLIFKNIQYWDKISTKQYLISNGVNLHNVLIKIWISIHELKCKIESCKNIGI